MQIRTHLFYLFLFFSFFMFSNKPKSGTYRGVLSLSETQNLLLPFNFELYYENNKAVLEIRNGEEKIRVDEIQFLKDSVFIRMPFFNSEFRCHIKKGIWDGYWINHYRKDKNKIPFRAYFKNKQRFETVPEGFNPQLEGKWETVFTSAQGDTTKAIGIFHHIEQSNYISGTFLTETGDYRFLEGVFHQNKLELSCFDGTHAFLFVAELDENKQLKGKFYSGVHWQESWTAIKNENAVLRDPKTITYVKNPGEVIEFEYPDTEGNLINSNSEAFRNKAMIIQLMGSWCPNCMDESKFLTGVYNQFQAKGLEIVALAFEKSTDFETAKNQVLRLKNRLGIPYPVLITQKTGKEMAGKSLPILNEVSAFPTTLFLDRSHQVVKIHTGFSGPATGDAYTQFVKETEDLIIGLLK